MASLRIFPFFLKLKSTFLTFLIMRQITSAVSYKHWQIENNKIPAWIRHSLATWVKCKQYVIVPYGLLRLNLKLLSRKLSHFSEIWQTSGALLVFLEPKRKLFCLFYGFNTLCKYWSTYSRSFLKVPPYLVLLPISSMISGMAEAKRASPTVRNST